MNLATASRPIALITGATGTIGPALLQSLLDKGYQVRALIRHQPSSVVFPSSVEVFKGEITERHVLKTATKGVGIIFHLAAKLHDPTPTPGLQDEYMHVNVEGTHRLAEAAQAAGVRRLVFFSTISVYGPTRPWEVWDEDSALRPDSWYTESKIQGEKIVLDKVPSVVLRLAAVYGGRMKGNYRRLLNAIRGRRFFVIGNGRNRRTLIYVDDVCTAALLVAEHANAVGRIYNVTDSQVHTLNEIVDAVNAALGQSSSKLRLPVLPVRLAARLVEDSFSAFGKKPPISRSTINKLTEDIAANGNKIQRELGFSPKYDLLTGWRECVRQVGN